MTRDTNPHYASSFDGLMGLVARLRRPDGCPWDREQTRDSMRRYVMEECFELLEAMDEGDSAKLAEELGDVLFHAAFQVHLGEEEGALTAEQVFGGVIEKLMRRHPHVFGEATASDAREVESGWHAIKRAEQAGTGASALNGVPHDMPALSYAQALQERAARTGFDWEDVRDVLRKVDEELDELQRAETSAEREAELGDLLFSIVNVGRWLDVDAESALRKAGTRFRQRFGLMEDLSREKGPSFEGLTMDEKDALWEEAKRTVA